MRSLVRGFSENNQIRPNAMLNPSRDRRRSAARRPQCTETTQCAVGALSSRTPFVRELVLGGRRVPLTRRSGLGLPRARPHNIRRAPILLRTSPALRTKCRTTRRAFRAATGEGAGCVVGLALKLRNAQSNVFHFECATFVRGLEPSPPHQPARVTRVNMRVVWDRLRCHTSVCRIQPTTQHRSGAGVKNEAACLGRYCNLRRRLHLETRLFHQFGGNTLRSRREDEIFGRSSS